MTEPTTIETAVERLLDERAIRKVLCRYARALDRQDWELLRSCYHDDAIDDHGSFRGNAEQLIEWLKAENGGYESTTHFLGNMLIEIDGDVAWAETYCIATHRRGATAEQPATDVVNFVRYCDRFERRDGVWRLAHRTVARDPGHNAPIVFEPPRSSRAASGKRDRTDPSYEGLLSES